MGRGRSTFTRGGGRSFSRDMVVDENGVASGKDRRARKKVGDSEDPNIEEESDEEESEDDDDEEDEEEGTSGRPGPSGSAPAEAELSRVERKALKKKQTEDRTKAQQEEEDPDFVNPNRAPAKNLAIADLGAPRELTRREREAKEKQEAKERYLKLHREGKTDEAKSDLARLQKIRQEREQAAAKRKAEAEAKTAELDAKKKGSNQKRAT